MKNVKTILGLAFVFQVALAGGLYLNKHSGGEFDEAQTLVKFEEAAVTSLNIASVNETGDVVELKITKDGDQWRVPSLENLPASKAKISEVLSKLSKVQVTWPVASSSASQSRFEVGEDKFQRKITIESESGSRVLYLGTSPGYRTVHARSNDASEIYSVSLATHDFPTEALDWLDKGILKAEQPTQIKGADFEIVNQDDNWAFAGPQAEGAPSLNSEKANELASVFSSIRITNIAEISNLENPLEVSVTANNQQYTYQFAEKDGTYYAKRSDLAPVFVIRDVDYEKIAGVNHNELAVSPSEDKEANETPQSVNPAVNPLGALEKSNVGDSIAVDVSQK